ncbi:MAG: low-specificity L-threonine aldolase [Anaerolineaceae bacterium]|nr:low-specificity L-threonine aldolase [Anaerolineaceae bacterium]
MKIIDLRSDTVTHPTPAMREAMAAAEVGDDVFREDPTINRLQEMAAKRMGKEAGLFLPTGTMGNLLAVMSHCQRGEEAMMGKFGHTFLHEAGGVSALGGVFVNTLPNQPDGTLDLDEVTAWIRSNDIHEPPSRLLILENTQNRCGGVPISAEYTHRAAQLVHQHGMKLHIDGARIFNAAAALHVPARELVDAADSVTFCLSKGLCAPVGSVLCGSAEFIEKARRLRKMVGGGMRQAGILAAAGIVALEQMTERLSEDHQRARKLAEGLAGIKGITLPMGMPQTNMLFPELSLDARVPLATLAQELLQQGIKIDVVSERMFRLVTHYWIDDADVERTLLQFSSLLAA